MPLAYPNPPFFSLRGLSWHQKSQVLARLQALGEWAVPGSRTSLFGSSACELHAHGADLDVTLLPGRTTAAPPTHAEQQALVRHLAVAFQPLLASGEFTQVEAIDRARVPILKMLHAESGLRSAIATWRSELSVHRAGRLWSSRSGHERKLVPVVAVAD
eukprot:scaffold15098_cov70-Phaeocystis_antarctica.AAC.2